MEHTSFLEYILESNVINLLIVLTILIYLVKKFKVGSFIAQKQKEIIDSVKTAEENKVNQELLLAKTREKARNTAKEVDNILKEADKVGDSLSSKVLSDAENEVENIKQRNIKSKEAEKEAATSALTKKVTNTAFLIAEEHIKQALDSETHKKFITEFIDELDETKVKS